MSSSEKTRRRMDESERTNHVKHMLENLSHRAGELASKLSKDGLPLDPSDKALCRLAMQPAMDECIDMIQFYMLKGKTVSAEIETDRMWDLYIK